MRINQESLETLWFEDVQGNKHYPGYNNFPAIPIANGYNYQHFRYCVVKHSIYNINGEAISESESTWNVDLVGAMFKSGDYGLYEAILIAGICCERCMNALLYRYLDEGYLEYSQEWLESRTECEFCKYMEPTQDTIFVDIEDRIKLAKSGFLKI